jgi:3-deoxy-manno-octulosonate cytidylyltransferase (CMP-KDO synthetase)
MEAICCIPARYNSTRLPGKPLLKINEKTIIQRVYDKATELYVSNIIVITNDQRIYDEVISFGGNCCIIEEPSLNGTEVICKYLKKHNIQCDIVVNVQGDEPFINIDDVNKAIKNYKLHKKINNKIVCSTLHHSTNEENEIKNKARCKLVLDQNNYIMYCSRNIIPSSKNYEIIPNHKYNIHIGVFVFDFNYLVNYYQKENTTLQLCEDIEWLKIIEQGYQIVSEEVDEAERGVDTVEDYEYLCNKYSN